MKDCDKNISGTISVWIVFCFVALALLFSMLLSSVEFGSYIIQLLIYAFLVGGVLVISRKKGVNAVERLQIKSKIHVINVFYVIAIGAGLLYFGSFFANFIYYAMEATGYTPIPNDISVNNIPELLLNIVFVSFLPAFCEEFIIRGSVFPSLKKSLSLNSAILLSSLFFGILHGSVVQFIHQFIVGIACCLLFTIGKSLWYPVILHAFNNGIALVLTYVQNISGLGEESLTAVEFFSQDVIVGQVVLAVIGWFIAVFAFLAFLRRSERDISEEYADQAIEKSISQRIKAFDEAKEQKVKSSGVEKLLFVVAIFVCIVMIGLDLIGGYLL